MLHCLSRENQNCLRTWGRGERKQPQEESLFSWQKDQDCSVNSQSSQQNRDGLWRLTMIYLWLPTAGSSHPARLPTAPSTPFTCAKLFLTIGVETGWVDLLCNSSRIFAFSCSVKRQSRSVQTCCFCQRSAESTPIQHKHARVSELGPLLLL